MTFSRHPNRRRFLIAASGAGLAVALPGVGALLTACSSTDDSSSTSGKRVTHRFFVESEAAALDTFVNAAGWTLTLERALLSIGPLYLFDGAPVALRHGPEPLNRRLARWLLPSAHAHPGHYVSGETLGEMLSPASVNLLERTELAAIAGVSGKVRSASFSFENPAPGPHATELGSAVVLLEGQASSAGDSKSFTLSASFDDIFSGDETDIVGCPFENPATTVDDDGTVTLTLRPSLWLDQVDFADFEEGVAEPDSSAQRAFLRGLLKAASYAFSFEP